MIHAEIARLLKGAMGLDPDSVGLSTIQRAVQDRQSACRLEDVQAYLNHLRTSDSELLELIEAVVVPETWFFRHLEAYVELARMIREDWLSSHATGVLRLLSLPCSTGEEPYSMAMALLDAEIPASRFQIDAVDISERALGLARSAEYGKNSFRGTDLAFRDRYFDLKQTRWQLRDRVRSQVRFQQGNVFSVSFLPGAEIFDVIFCRNMLIYFDRFAQEHVVMVLRRLLTERGTLFVGPSETTLLMRHDLVSAKVPRTFAFHKRTADSVRVATKSGNPDKPPSFSSQPPPSRARFRKPTATPQVKPPPVSLAGNIKTRCEGVAEAALLADQGRLDEAEKCCEEHMRNKGVSADALYLMGLIRDASGNLTDAANYYRKALYLDQYHQEAMSQLALLLRKKGDVAGARRLGNRVNRAGQKGNK
jgi:chemotaxis protein methyltransferase WspC